MDGSIFGYCVVDCDLGKLLVAEEQQPVGSSQRNELLCARIEVGLLEIDPQHLHSEGGVKRPRFVHSQNSSANRVELDIAAAAPEYNRLRRIVGGDLHEPVDQARGARAPPLRGARRRGKPRARFR